MASFNIVMPKMGESIQEATITKWFVKPGDKVEEDDVLLEIATDKVDSEVPSPVDGVVKEVLYNVDDTVAVGEIIAVIDMDGEAGADTAEETSGDEVEKKEEKDSGKEQVEETKVEEGEEGKEPGARSSSGKFFSPVVRKIAKENGLSESDLESIKGSGLNGRVNKEDVLAYLEDGGAKSEVKAEPKTEKASDQPKAPAQPIQAAKIEVPVSGEDEIIEMDRMRKKIAEHMVASKQISPHVTSVVEADVTTLVNWRNKVKDQFQKKYGQKLTFMPVFAEAVAKALRDFPWVNASVNGDQIILKKNVNIGIAVSLPSGNLIVPVVKNADMMNLAGLASNINGLASKARDNKLSPDDIQGGTFTITNFGSFDNIIGTPIINQPQVAILATGSIKKKVSVIETPEGDTIGIRSKMYLSLSYDHRIVDGMLGGQFLRRVGDYLENFDPERTV
ncbi:dihydrolipoamide acetyltransferase family protein [Saccharicrinis sp. FJH2]|uniref:dihydrolipoamide acetyltransferase family protein n=1 Tax=Saccharicrinis sp. FJH65 TaxID=3344659 RepID=UPI0035F26C46